MFLLLSVAMADVVGPGPTDCPAGSSPDAYHGGPFCAPQTCTDSVCPGGDSCEPAGLCVLVEERECGGLTDPENPCTFTHTEALGVCETSDDCAGDIPCVVENRCVPPQGAAGCGCSANTVLPAAVFGLGLLPLIGRRRRTGSARE